MTSLREYQIRLRGLERKQRMAWEHSRWEVWQLLSPHYKRGRAPQTPQAFCRFPWERAENNIEDMQQSLERSRVSAEEAAALNALFNKNLNNGQNR